MKERAILATLDWGKGRAGVSDAASELEELCRSAGLEVKDSLILSVGHPNAALLMGKGKVEELRRLVETHRSQVVVFDADLSPSQQRNIETIVRVKTLDRTQLILDIFALRARSMEGKLQVELAQLQYLLPRLAGQGIYLSRLGGGVGTRGPGEQKLEMDRRRLRERIFRLQKELKGLQKRRTQAIERKKEKGLPLIALAGYTNAGKSTLFNRLTNSDVLVKDQLFSTLDTTTRLLELPGNQKALLVDTVGFVRRIPHHLIEAFKASLEEAVQADILLHVTDAGRPDLPEVRQAVEEVLEGLGIDLAKTVEVGNKTDLLPASKKEALPVFGSQKIFYVSALTGEGIEQLGRFLSERLTEDRAVRSFFVPKDRLRLAGFLYREAEVLDRQDTAEGSLFKVRLLPSHEKMFEKRLNSRRE